MPGRFHNRHLRRFGTALESEAILAIVARGIERVLVAHHQHAGVGRLEGLLHFFPLGVGFLLPREAGKERLIGELAAVIPLHLHVLAVPQLGEVEVDHRPLGIGLFVVAAGVGLHSGRIAEIERHKRHVERVAGHVAQGSGAEVPEAAPREGMVAHAIGPQRGWAEP